jgi:putative ABC transport system ATP-binding protein
MAVYEWRLAVLVLVGVIGYAASLLWFQGILRRRYDRVRENVANSLAVMGEAINALPEVRAYGAEKATLARVADALERRFQAQFKAAHFGNVLFSTAEIFAAALTAVVIAAGLFLGADEGITVGVLLAFLFLVNLLIAPVQTLVRSRLCSECRLGIAPSSTPRRARRIPEAERSTCLRASSTSLSAGWALPIRAAPR